MKYLQANLHPEGLGGTLPEALAMAHQPRAPVLPRTRIALARYLNAADGTWSHAGAMRGFTSYAFFHPKSATIAATLCESCSACRSAVCARWSRPDEEELRFEEEATPGVLELGLHRDGVMPLGPPAG